MKKRFRLLFWLVKEQYAISRLLFFWKIVYSIYDGLSSVLSVYVVAQIISAVTKVALTDGPTSEVYRWVIIGLLLEVVIKVIDMFNSLFDSRLNDKIEIVFNKKIMTKMYDLALEQFEDEQFNTQLERSYDGLMAVNNTLREMSWLVSSFVRFLGSFFAIVTVSPLVGGLVILASIPGVIVSLKQNKYREQVYRDTESTERVVYRTRWLLVNPQSMPEVRLVNGFSKLLEQWVKHKKKTDEAYFTMLKRTSLQNLGTTLVEPLLQFGALLIYFRELVAGKIALDTFFFLRSLTEQLVNAVNSIASSLQTMDQRFIELGNFRDILDTPSTLPNGTVQVTRPLKIELENVSFRYPNAKDDVLKDVSFVIHPGSKLAIVGENGAGKSTLLKLLLRQYLPTKGRILVNGTDIADVDQESYYAAIGNLSQDFLTVHHLTVRDNLLLGIPDVSTDKILHTLDLVGAKEFVEKLKHKLETRLDTSFKDGTDLSGGQLQRLGVARTLLRGGDVLILDEPTSAIDAKAEFAIFNNVYKEHGGKTTLIVSHRFSTVRKADAIIVMADGKITEYGSHEELLKFGGLYKEMFDLQAEGYR